MTEHRRHPRSELRRRVWCEGDDYTVWLQIRNASEHGLQLRTSIPPAPGTRLRLSLEEPGAGRVVAEAEVVWALASRGKGAMGLRILSFSEGQELWRRLVGATADGERSATE
jgi:hypothetical protein